MCERHKKSLSKVKNILCDGGYTGLSFTQSIKETIDCSGEKPLNARNFISSLCYPNAGLWGGPLLGWKIIEDCEL